MGPGNRTCGPQLGTDTVLDKGGDAPEIEENGIFEGNYDMDKKAGVVINLHIVA